MDAESNGAVLSETPPCYPPHKSRSPTSISNPSYSPHISRPSPLNLHPQDTVPPSTFRECGTCKTVAVRLWSWLLGVYGTGLGVWALRVTARRCVVLSRERQQGTSPKCWPYDRPTTPRALWWSQGGMTVSYERGTPVFKRHPSEKDTSTSLNALQVTTRSFRWSTLNLRNISTRKVNSKP